MRFVSSQKGLLWDCCAKTSLGQRGGQGFGTTLVQIDFPSSSQEMKDLEGEKNQRENFPNIMVVVTC